MQPVFVTLWPDAENYERFAALCVDQVPGTVEAYHANAAAKLEKVAASGVEIERIAFDPDKLSAWARETGARIDADGRAQYAAILYRNRKFSN